MHFKYIQTKQLKAKRYINAADEANHRFFIEVGLVVMLLSLSGDENPFNSVPVPVNLLYEFVFYAKQNRHPLYACCRIENCQL